MNNDLKRVGLVFNSEGNVDFVKTLKEVNSSLRENYNQFKITQAQWDSSTSSSEKLTKKQEYLSNAYKIQSEKVEMLTKQLDELKTIEADNQRTIEKKEKALSQAKIQLEKYGVELKNVENKLHSSVAKNEEFVKSLEKTGDKIENVGKKVSVLSGLATAGIAASVKSAMDFETAFTGVEKTVDGTEEQMQALKQGIRDMAKEIPASTTEISAVAEAAGQLGIETDNILGFTRTMIDMGNATNLSSEEAATTLARFANVTKMSQQDFDKLGSTIVALGNNFATTELEIAQMGMNLASAGSQVGMSQSEIMALATALSSVGLEAEAGGTAFSKLMINMQLAVETGSDQLKDFARVAGMSVDDFSKAFKEDATSAIMAFIDGLSKSGEQGDSAIKILDDMGISETRLRDAILRSTNASELFSKAVNLGNDAWSNNTALTDEASKKYNTLKNKLEILKNKFLDHVITLGNKLMPTVEKMLDGLGKWVGKLDKLNDSQIETIIKLGGLVAAAGPAITIIGKITTGVGNGVQAFSILRDAIKVTQDKIVSTDTTVNNLAKVFSALGSPTGIAVIGITALVGVIATISSKTKSVTKDVEDDFKTMGESAKGFVDGVNNATSQLSNFSDRLFISSEEQAELSQNMITAQDGITQIVNLASQERRGYTDQEIQKLNEYFQAMHDISQRELEVQQQKSQAIIQVYSQEIESYSGSIEGYQSFVQEKIKTMQDQRDVELQLIEQSTVEQIALLNQRYGSQATMQNEAYAQEYNKIIAQKEANIEQANQEFATMYEIVTNGYAERIKADDKYYELLQTLREKIKKENECYEQELKKQDEKWKDDEFQRDAAHVVQKQIHQKNLNKIYNDMYKDLDEESAKQLGVYLTMISYTELYGGKLDSKTKDIVNGIVGTYGTMPKKTKKTMQDAMQPMLEEMEKSEPKLLAKATNIATGILGKLKAAFDIHSPSRKTRTIFQNVMRGAEKGIESEEKSLYQKTDKISSNVLKKFEKLEDSIESNDKLDINKNFASNIKNSSIENTNLIIDYNQLYLCFLQALNNCKIKLDDDGFIRIVDNRLREVM